MKIEAFPITERGHTLARRLAARFTDLVIHRPAELKDGGLSRAAKEAFKRSRAIIFICASGIAVRTIAPFIRAKASDPAVILMDEKGRFVVSLLSGHLGGANRLARIIADHIKATPVITTATDVMGLPCAEDIAERLNLAIEDAKKIKKVNSAILEGVKVSIVDKDLKRLKEIRRLYKDYGVFRFGNVFPDNHAGIPAFIFISSSTAALPSKIDEKTLVMRPREFAVGLGCGSGVSVKEVRDALNRALSEAGISPLSVRNLATIDIKKDEPGLRGFAEKSGLRIEFFNATELKKVRPPSGQSRFVAEVTGAGGVSEPAALLSAGVRRIWIKKRKIGRVTVAAARVPFTS